MKSIRLLTLISGVVILALSIGFVFRIPFVIGIWPWEDGRYSYLFVGSILAAVSVAALWIGWKKEFGAFPAGSLNIFVIAVTTAIYFFQLAIRDGRMNLVPFGIASAGMAAASGFAFFWSRKFPLHDSRPTPQLVKISFGIFIAALFLAGGALILRMPIFPWALNSDSSVIFGCIFLGDAFYFLYGLIRPSWHNAIGQLLSFLAYDLVLIVPFIGLLKTVEPEYVFNLIVYIAVLVYSGGIAIYYLFINRQTKLQ